jgi:hypothetical protein
VLHAKIHPTVAFFHALGDSALVSRYCHLHPKVDPEVLHLVLAYQPRLFCWAGADLLHATTESGARHMVVVETNSCPSGQKSMPLLDPAQVQGGYRALMERTFLPLIEAPGGPEGGLAVLYDKNPMENSGYAAAMSDCTGEPVLLTDFHDGDPDPPVRVGVSGPLEVRDESGTWRPIRAAFRYVTQRPWNRLPVSCTTRILNPVIACLAGGRNKMVAAKAYDFYNAELAGSGLAIRTPETIRDVSLEEIPLWVRSFGGHAVVKVPYSNAGQGVYTITSAAELEAFMALEHPYEQFIVQSLIGNFRWSSRSATGQLYHVGTVPDRAGGIYVADLRMMVSAGADGFRPLAIYARRARLPLTDVLEPGVQSWDMLGTNLSIRRPDGSWEADTGRLVLMDCADFDTLGIGLDDLIEGYVQTVLAAIAIDRMAQDLTTPRGTLRRSLFRSLDDDDRLLAEILSDETDAASTGHR